MYKYMYSHIYMYMFTVDYVVCVYYIDVVLFVCFLYVTMVIAGGGGARLGGAEEDIQESTRHS